MKKNILIAVVVALMAVATPALAHGHRVVVVRPRPVYVHRPVLVRHYVPVYRPVYVAPRPVVYVRPQVVQAQPIYVPAPAPIVQQLRIPEGFVETGRDLHSHGSNAGLVDELTGVLNGKKVTIEYNDDGTIENIEDD